MNKPVSIKVPYVVEVVSIGEGHGIVLPLELLAKLGVHAGGKLDVLESPDGLALRRHDADFADAMAAAKTVMEEDRDVLAVLARSAAWQCRASSAPRSPALSMIGNLLSMAALRESRTKVCSSRLSHGY